MANAFAPTQVRRGGSRSTATRRWRGGDPAAPRGIRAYRLCLLSWVGGEPTEALIERMRQAAVRRDRKSRLVSVDTGAQALIVPDDPAGGSSRERVHAAVDCVVEVVHAVRPDVEIHAVVGDRITSLEQLRVVAARLQLLARYARARRGDEVIWAQRHSLACLLETLDPRQASTFVDGQLATLRAHDREHGTNLQRVLELALDHENRNTAARAAFMHRNTFRRQLAKALELIDVDLACPEERLALHVALKMRSSTPAGSVVQVRTPGPLPPSSRGAPSTPGR